MKLAPCASCARHKKPEEDACPFCGARIAKGGWVATLLVGAALAGVACKEDPIAVPPYGIPPMEDAGARDSGTTDAGS